MSPVEGLTLELDISTKAQNTILMVPSGPKLCLTIYVVVWIQYTSATDRQMDGPPVDSYDHAYAWRCAAIIFKSFFATSECTEAHYCHSKFFLGYLVITR